MLSTVFVKGLPLSDVLVLLTKESMCGKLLYEDVKITGNVYPLNLISVLKSKIS